MVLTVAVLGAVKARRDGDRLSVPAGKTTELLVRLALDAGSRVRVDILLEDVWPTSAGRNTLQSKVSQLRRALGDKDLAAETDDRDSLEEVLTLARADENHVVTILALDGLARLSADECEPERAAELVARRTPSSPRSLICSTTQTCPTARQRVVSAHNTVSPAATLIRVVLVPAGEGHPDREHHERYGRWASSGRGLVGEPGLGCQDAHGDEAHPRDRRDPTEPAPSAAGHAEAEAQAE